MAARIPELERHIERLKQHLLELGDLRPGSLSEQYNVCGNPRCRCKEDPRNRHGPYYQLSWTRTKKSTTRFIRKPDVPALKEQIKNYERLRELVDDWVDTSIKICDLKLKASRTVSRLSTQR
jgi:hypothetical protein